MLFKHLFSVFFIIWVTIFITSFINFNNKIMIFKPNIWFPVIKFLLSTIFSLGKIFIIFSAIDFSSQTIMPSWLYRDFFLNSMASVNLRRSMISRVSFSIRKIPFSPLKNALYFCFSSSVLSFVFFPQYFLRQYHKYLNVLFVFRHCLRFAKIHLYLLFHCNALLF